MFKIKKFVFFFIAAHLSSLREKIKNKNVLVNIDKSGVDHMQSFFFLIFFFVYISKKTEKKISYSIKHK